MKLRDQAVTDMGNRVHPLHIRQARRPGWDITGGVLMRCTLYFISLLNYSISI